MIDVTICSPNDIAPAAWQALCARAEGNVFMDPVALAAAATMGFADIRMLAAWEAGASSRRLVGLWALNCARPLPLFPRLLEGLPFYYAFNATPVIDGECADEVATALVAALARELGLPRVLNLKSLDGDSRSGKALLAAFSSQSHRSIILRESARPYATRAAGVKTSGATRKTLRRNWNRLCEAGAVDLVNDRTTAEACAAFEIFLNLEHASWKGSHGTSLLSDPADAAFVRRLFADLAAVGRASVGLLRLDRRPVAAQVMLYSGDAAFTWKTAFDSDFGRFSPGALMVDKMAEFVLSDPQMRAVDSCAVETSFMGQMWSGRRRMVDVLVDVGAQSSLTFMLEAGRERALDIARDGRDRLRALKEALKQRPAPLARSAA